MIIEKMKERYKHMRILTYIISNDNFSVATTSLDKALEYSSQLGVPYRVELIKTVKKSHYNEKRVAAIRSRAKA